MLPPPSIIFYIFLYLSAYAKLSLRWYKFKMSNCWFHVLQIAAFQLVTFSCWNPRAEWNLTLPMDCRIPGQHHILSYIINYYHIYIYTCIIMYPNVMYPNATLGTWFASVVLNSRLESYCQVWRTSPRFISTKKSIRTGNRKAPAWKSHNENTVANCFCFFPFFNG